MNIQMTVNGQSRGADVEPRLLLVHFLRENLGLTGTKIGCDTSQCGSCVVRMNGSTVKSCTALAVQADGADITTIEGLGRGRGTARDAGSLLEQARPPVRLLHRRHDL